MDLCCYSVILLVLLVFTVSGDSCIESQRIKEARSFHTIHSVHSVRPEERRHEMLSAANCCKHNSTWADCSGLGLHSIPDDLSTSITYLDISENKIDKLGNTLARYSNLKYLNLKKNNLHLLSNENFSNLTQLLYLDLEENNLTMDSAYPPFVFGPLVSLRTLKIDRNNPDLTVPGLSYPDQALSLLTNLVSLYMDGLMNQTLGSGFRKLTSLKKMTLSGPPDDICKPVFVRNDTFINVPYLEFLNLTKCCINGLLMEQGVFDHLKNLKVLDLSRNGHMCLDDLGHVLKSLKESNITYLGMTHVLYPYLTCVHVSKTFVEILPKHLRILVANSNNFEVVQDDVIDSLPKNLVELDISANRFTFGKYLMNLSRLENLRYLYLNGAAFTYNLPTEFPDYESSNCTEAYQTRSKFTCDRECTENKALLKLPPNLKTVILEFAGWSYSLTRFEIDPNNSLQNLKLNGNNIQKLVGPITGLDGLKQLHLVKCNIYSISETFFNTFTSLEKLNLSSNFFGTQLSDGSNPIFTKLANLKYLDLSFNNILTINYHAFEGLVGLQQLWLHNNGFYYFHVNIFHMSKISLIDFRFTELSHLNESIIKFLDKLGANNSNNLTVDFSETPIHCYCENLYFLEWIVKSPIFHHSLTRYKCVFSDTSEKYMTNFDDVYNNLSKECTPHFKLFLVILLATVTALGAVLVAVVYRFRWKLKYLYYSAYITLKKKEDHNILGNDFEYDVFTSYVQDDHDFVVENLFPQLQSRGLKVHIHGLHFLAGEHISVNILNAVQKSRHTLIVLTQHWMDSKWCRFELQMANMHSVHTGRPVLVFLLMENFAQKINDLDLLYYIQNNTYIKYPGSEECPDEHQMDLFWTKLATDLIS